MTVARPRRRRGHPLADLCRVTGLGPALRAKPAQATSPPAGVLDHLQQARVCRAGRSCRAFPLRARKRRDFTIWARAVDRWSAARYDAAGRLATSTRRWPPTPARFASCGVMSTSPPRLRSTPAPACRPRGPVPGRLLHGRRLLRVEWAEAAGGRQAAAATIAGSSNSSPSASSGPSATILRTATPTRWQRGSSAPAMSWARRSASSTPRNCGAVSAASSRSGAKPPKSGVGADGGASADVRGSDGPETGSRPCGPTTRRRSPCRDRRARDAREAYIDVLRAFADEVPDGRLTCTAYASAREPSRVADAEHARDGVRELGAGLGPRIGRPRQLVAP